MAGHFQGHNNNAAEVASAISGYQRGSGRLALNTGANTRAATVTGATWNRDQLA